MRSFSTHAQLAIGAVLVILMGISRGYHFASIEQLPNASWAVFFLAGSYLSSRWVFPALLAEAAVLDFTAVMWGGVSSFCVSPAYGFLIPAYGVLWVAGRWYAERHRDTVATLALLAMSVLVGGAVCELISSGSFYFFSGRFESTSLAGFAHRFVRYLPQSISSLAFYVFVAGVIHAVVRMPFTIFFRPRTFS